MSENAIIEQLEDKRLEEETNKFAAEFLLGELIKAASKQFKELALPWHSMSQTEQETVLHRLKEDCWTAAKKAIICIASDNRVNFRAEVKSVQFLDGEVKAQLVMVNTPEAHDLANAAGGHVTIVIEDGKRYLEVGDACDGEPDQHALFDESTGGEMAADADAVVGDDDEGPKGPAEVRYRHPDDEGLTWSGRGRRPSWVQNWLDGDGTLEQLDTFQPAEQKAA
jgi:hypothetical protein